MIPAVTRRLLLLCLIPLLACAPAEPASAPDAAWLAEVSARIDAGRYRFVQDELGVSAAVPGGDLRARWRDDGLELRPRDGAALRVRLAGASGPAHPGGCRLDGAVDATGRCLRRLERPGDRVTEWFENRPEGLLHGFTVTSPGDVELGIEGAEVRVDDDGRGATFTLPDGALLTWRGLRAWDADGRDLPATMETSVDGLRLRVQDEAAAWPITIDPVWTTAGQSFQADLASAALGSRIASGGDLNGDGWADLAVSAPTYSHSATADGAVFVWYGGPGGLSTTADWSAGSGVDDSEFGHDVDLGGDANGDGLADLAVGSPAYQSSASNPYQGRIFVWFGNTSGLAASASWAHTVGTAYDKLGESVAWLGDVNGDGYGDVAAGATWYGSQYGNEGAVFVYLGSAGGLPATFSDRLLGGAANTYMGSAVDSAGDVNGDGYSDLVVGASACCSGNATQGAAWLYLGSASGLEPDADWITAGGASSYYGGQVAGLGDVNGDGLSDVAVGAWSHTDSFGAEGRVRVYYGNSGGLSGSPSWQVVGGQVGAYLGWDVAAAGDVDGDGYADLLAGAPGWDDVSGDPTGRASLWRGGPGGLETSPSWEVEGPVLAAGFGSAVAGGGDLGGDGLPDVVVGAPTLSDGEPGEGGFFVFDVTGSAPAAAPAWEVDGPSSAAQLGISVAGAGDVNGDGHDDVVVGAPGADGGLPGEGLALLYTGASSGLSTAAAWTGQGGQVLAGLGAAVAGPGDVDGDGYADLLIGAPEQGPNGQVHLYLGSSSGPAAAPAWSHEWASGADFGQAVAGAGDVNGDGLADLLVGAPNHMEALLGEGAAILFLGGLDGPGDAPDWVAFGGQELAGLGTSVARGGDLDGDGYGDIVVGAPGWDDTGSDHGRAFAWLGGPSGPAAAPDWTWTGADAQGEAGAAVAGVGDVDGDGYADLLVGAPGQGIVQSQEGLAWLFEGSASGPSTSSTWVAQGDSDDARLGAAVAAAGDVNGDGYGDILVGLPGLVAAVADAGGARLYLGGAGGPDTLHDWASVCADASDCEEGWSVASAGDVDGDGFADLLIGRPGTDASGSDAGHAALYLGNSLYGETRTGRPVPLAFQGGTGEPLAPEGRLDDLALDLSLFVRSAWGDTDARLEVELKELGTPFDGAGLVHTSWTDPSPAGTRLTASLSSGLAEGVAYRYRLRVDWRAAQAPVSSYGPWLYGGISGEPDGVHFVIPVYDADGDGYRNDVDDCDDADAAVYPGATEVCDAIDQDCDGDLVETWLDTDGDGTPDCGDDDDDDDGFDDGADNCPLVVNGDQEDTDGDLDGDACDDDDDGDGSLDGDDCDPVDAASYPGAPEVCDAIDQDCDGDLLESFTDTDGDGEADCTDDDDDGDGSADGEDCAPLDPAIHPGAPEVCDAIDSDCDASLVDEDADTDGDGDPDCTDDDDDGDGDPDASDCAPLDPAIHAGAAEFCDAIDADCDGDLVDGFLDSDGDGEPDCVDFDDDGDGAIDGDDCAPLDPTTYPGAVELCDGLDNDCDGQVPEGELDQDGDSLSPCQGDCDDANYLVYPGLPEACDGVDTDCDPVTSETGDSDVDGVTPCSGDCDDGDPAVFEGNPELCDGLDNDCDPATDETVDGDTDGWDVCAGDCDDDDPDVSPAADELCDGLDTDCDGVVPTDEDDGDGDGSPACDDCDDDDPDSFPDAPEVCDGVDNDCDGQTSDEELDEDGDGQRPCSGDCDDGEPTVYDGAAEVCDGLDNDCDGGVPDDEVDLDGDGWLDCEDCDDDDEAVHPEAVELCDLVDHDCDGDLVGPWPDADDNGVPECEQPGDELPPAPGFAVDCSVSGRRSTTGLLLLILALLHAARARGRR